ncbi:hypothetical protein AAHE18_05G094700 [Arachis hypogaea]|nr:uncharacterized protein DS421_5g144420 [Arachis hypogaea]
MKTETENTIPNINETQMRPLEERGMAAKARSRRTDEHQQRQRSESGETQIVEERCRRRKRKIDFSTRDESSQTGKERLVIEEGKERKREERKERRKEGKLAWIVGEEGVDYFGGEDTKDDKEMKLEETSPKEITAVRDVAERDRCRRRCH